MEQIRLSKPFSNVIISPDVLPIDLGKKHIRYKGYHELAYLGPGYFQKNSAVFKDLGIPEGTPYAILRFVSWNASHDIGQKGLTDKDKIKLVNYLATKMNVYISAERRLIPELESYRINIPVTKMHDALAFATIYIGEGATMASEAGILGTPSVYISTIKISYTQDQENYGTVFNFTNFDDAFTIITNIISSADFRKNVVKGKDRLLQEKIDVTAFLVWFVENYPESAKIMKENPDYQERFRF
jgi:predicted glycosyltransferase